MNATRPPLDVQAFENPFSARRIRPGAVEFVFEPGQTADSLIDRLKAHRWWGEIVGPHGSGKSTLAATLAAAIKSTGRRFVRLSFCREHGRFSAPRDACHNWSQDTQVLADGFERCTWWERRRLLRLCRRSGAGLLVTAHAPSGLPTLMRIAPNLTTARIVAAKLTRNFPPLVHDQDVERGFIACEGNLRELLFWLYDLYEHRRARQAAFSHAP